MRPRASSPYPRATLTSSHSEVKEVPADSPEAKQWPLWTPSEDTDKDNAASHASTQPSASNSNDPSTADPARLRSSQSSKLVLVLHALQGFLAYSLSPLLRTHLCLVGLVRLGLGLSSYVNATVSERTE